MNTPFHKDVVLGESSKRWITRAEAAAMVLIVAALARPVLLTPSPIKSISYDPVYLALDLSASMHAQDRSPSRLEYSKKVIREILRKESSFRYGLFGFTTNALILSPATRDKNLVKAALESINPDFIITRGTNIETLLEVVAKMADKRKRLVILSDGGDGLDIERSIEICDKGGVKVYVVEAATKMGAPIPKKGAEGFVRDEKGRLVISMQNGALSELAKATGGDTIEANSPEEAADKLLIKLEKGSKAEATYTKTEVTELFWIPLSAAILLFFVTVVRVPFDSKSTLLFFSVLVAVEPSEAGSLDLWRLHESYRLYENGDYNLSLSEIERVEVPTLQSIFAKASILYKMGAYKEAGRIFSSLKSDDAVTKSAIFYDMGNCAVELGRYESAREFYVKSLQLTADEDAMKNLSLILFLDENRTKKPNAAAKRTIKASASAKASEKSGSKREKESQSSGGRSGGSGSAKGGKDSTSSSPSHALKRALGSKAYELINKGYVDERRPW
ncbi:MAG: VWA domain-containing protein [Hydrogenimonas sp.]|nr:VWA domain-containing protein [Hydrogenimonas sp.]